MDQAEIDTQTNLIFAYLKAIYDVAGYAEPLMWLIKTQLPKAGSLDATRVNRIMDTVINCLGYRMWYSSRLMFHSVLVLIIFDHYKALHYKDLSEIVTKYPQFSCLSAHEQKQLLSFRNLLVVAVKIFDPHENATDVLILVGSICGHTSSWCTDLTKRSHRELIFLRETGIEARYPPINSKETSFPAAKPNISARNLTSMRVNCTGSKDSTTRNKRRTEQTSPSPHAPVKRVRGQHVHVTDETSATQICPSVAEGAYDILQLYRAYRSSSSSEGSDGDTECYTGKDKHDVNAADGDDEKEEEREEDEASLQSVSEEEEEEGETEEVDGSVIFNSTPVAADRRCASTRSGKKGGTKRPNNTNSSVWESIFDAPSADCAISDRKISTEDTMHHNNVHIAADKVFRMAPFPCGGPMYDVLNAHLGYHAPPAAAPTHSTPNIHSWYPFCYNGPALYNIQPGGGLSAAYNSPYAEPYSDHHTPRGVR